MIPTIPIAPLALHSGPHDVVGEARSEQPAASIERDGENRRHVRHSVRRDGQRIRGLALFHEEVTMFVRKLFLAALAMLVPLAAGAATRCDAVLAALADKLVDATCFEKGDLTTNGDFTDANLTTPANNSIAGLPPGAFTPNTDRNVISPNPPNRTPITKVVPGIQLDA